MSTEKFLTFKGIYLEDDGRYFLCDFFSTEDRKCYRVIVQHPYERSQEALFTKNAITGTWQLQDSRSSLSGLLIRKIADQIQSIEEGKPVASVMP